MKIYIRFLCALFLLAAAEFSPVLADSDFPSELLKHIKIVPYSRNNDINTYEDTEGLVLDPVADLIINFLPEKVIPQGAVMASDAARFLRRLRSGYTVISSRYNTLKDLVKGAVYLEEKESASDKPFRIGVGRNSFPYSVDKNIMKVPQFRVFGIGLKGNVKYSWCRSVPALTPDVSSCDLGCCDCFKRGLSSHEHKLDMISDFRGKLKSKFHKSKHVDAKKSGYEFTINIQDRTPPVILGDYSIKGELPFLSGINSASTGDIYRLKGLSLNDNSSDYIGASLALFRIYSDNFPMIYWKKSEVLERRHTVQVMINEDEKGNVIPALLNNEFFIPNLCFGIMRYVLIAWDEYGNVNMSESTIKEDDPENAYGFSCAEPLSVKWNDRVGKLRFPVVLDMEGGKLPGEVYEGEVDHKKSAKLGSLNIIDNDSPNLIIRISSVDHKDEVFYFPPFDKGMKLNPYPEYYNPLKCTSDSNQEAYEKFISKGLANQEIFEYYGINETASASVPYYMLLNMTQRPKLIVETDESYNAEKNVITKLNKSKNLGFVKSQIRLEDQNFSDTDIDGEPIIDEDSFGLRCGTGEQITAFLNMGAEFPVALSAGEEYKIDVWADDSVKWANIDKNGKVKDVVKRLPTGIARGSFKFCDPQGTKKESVFGENQYDEEKAVNGSLNFVVEKPTPDIWVRSEGDLQMFEFPYIEAVVYDYSGLKRSIKLYLKVNDSQVMKKKREDALKKEIF